MIWPHGDPDAVVRRVLAGGDFRSAVTTSPAKPHATLFGVVWDWVWEHLLRPLLHPLGHALAASRDAGTAVGIALVFIALGGLAFVAFRLALAFVRVPAERAERARDVLPELAAPRNSRDWRDLAAAAAGRGEYARAVAALFSAALALLDECDVIARDAARTPGEYRRMLRRARPAAAVPFDELAEHFVNALYAPHAPGSEAYEAAVRALAAFERALEGGDAAFAA